MIKNKLVFLAAISLVSSAAVYAADQSMAAHDKKVAPVAATKVVKKKHRFVKKGPTVSAVDSRTKVLEAQVSDLKTQVAGLQKQQEYAKSSTSWSKIYAYGPAIATTPIIGQPDYSGYDLYINMPSINEDMALLKFNQQLANYYNQNNITPSDRPIIALTGEVEGQALNSSSFNDSSRSDINLSTVALETVINANSWITGLVKFEYSDTPPEIGARVTNSNVKVKRAYVTVGNLNEFPVYATIGQLYVPFGAYNYWTISDSLTKTIGRLEERAIVLGFNKCGAYGSLFAYEGDSHSGGGNSINSWGANLGYIFSQAKWSLDVGASYVANIADSQGMQDTGFTSVDSSRTFEGFKNHEQLEKQVPAADVHALFKYDPVWISVEYLSALNDFNKQDLTFNDNGAKPKAFDVQGIYNFNFIGKPAFVTAGFGESWESLGLNIPKYSYIVSTGISMFKNTVQSIEYRHDINYNKNDVSTSNGDVFVPGDHERNIFTASFKLFF